MFIDVHVADYTLWLLHCFQLHKYVFVFELKCVGCVPRMFFANRYAVFGDVQFGYNWEVLTHQFFSHLFTANARKNTLQHKLFLLHIYFKYYLYTSKRLSSTLCPESGVCSTRSGFTICPLNFILWMECRTAVQIQVAKPRLSCSELDINLPWKPTWLFDFTHSNNFHTRIHREGRGGRVHVSNTYIHSGILSLHLLTTTLILQKMW